MKRSFEAAIVGAGPAGISAACTLADQGVSTIVFERGEFPGAKNMSGGVVYGRDLEKIIPDFAERKCPVERNIVKSRIWYLNKNGGYSISYMDTAFSDRFLHNAFTVGRAKFDRWFAGQASEKGALVVCGTVVTDLIRDGSGKVTGVRTDRPEGDLHADVVLLADGINSPLAKRAGFRPDPSPDQVALAVKEVVELPEDTIEERFHVSDQDGVTTEIIGDFTCGMNGIGVIYTNRKSLSLCIGADIEDLSSARIKPYELMESFKEHPMVASLIRGGKTVEYMAHWLPEGGYDHIPELCGDGYLIAGDSAMLFNKLHREGSNLAMTSGRLAAEAILEAREAGEFSKTSLQGYVNRMENSFVIKDLKKYRRFNLFLRKHREIYTTLPGAAGFAAREMLNSNDISKKTKQKIIWRNLRKGHSLKGLIGLIWDAVRSV